jgi:hypothetical protein
MQTFNRAVGRGMPASKNVWPKITSVMVLEITVPFSTEKLVSAKALRE